MAEDAGLTVATLSLIARGLANPTWDSVKKIAAALDLSMAEMGKAVDKQEARLARENATKM